MIKLYGCNKRGCWVLTTSKKELKDHIFTDHVKRIKSNVTITNKHKHTFTCSKCNYSSSTRIGLVNHYNNSEQCSKNKKMCSNNKKQCYRKDVVFFTYTCKFCNIEFKSPLDHANHFLTHF